MANLFLSIPVPVVGVGIPVNVALVAPFKTFVVAGNAASGVVIIEGSEDGTNFFGIGRVDISPLAIPRPIIYFGVLQFVRVRREGGSGTPTVTLGAESVVGQSFGTLNVPNQNGVGVVTNSSLFGDLLTLATIGTMEAPGFLLVEGTQDGVVFNAIARFDGPITPDKLRQITIQGNFQGLRVRRENSSPSVVGIQYGQGEANTAGPGPSPDHIEEILTNNTNVDIEDAYLVKIAGNSIIDIADGTNATTGQGTIGVTKFDIPQNSAGPVITDGKANIKLISGLINVIAGQTLWLDPNNIGRATTVKPSAPNAVICVGIIKDATGISNPTGFDEIVIADIDVDCESRPVPENLQEILTNGNQFDLFQGEIVHIIANSTIDRALADSSIDVQGTIGVTAAPILAFTPGPIITDGKAIALLEVGLIGVAAGQTLWVSPNVNGRCTNVKPLIALCVGTIKDASNYGINNTVIADIDPECHLQDCPEFLCEDLTNIEEDDLPLGTVVRIANDSEITPASAAAGSNLAQGTIGVTGELIQQSSIGKVITDGKAEVIMETGLTNISAGQTIWLSPTSGDGGVGTATNVKPTPPDDILCLGVIKDTNQISNPSTAGQTVIADIDPECEPHGCDEYLCEALNNPSEGDIAEGAILGIKTDGTNRNVQEIVGTDATQVQSVVGVAQALIPAGGSGPVVTHGRVRVQLISGLDDIVAGQRLWLSDSVGQATVFRPNHIQAVELGVIKDATGVSNPTQSGDLVVVDITPVVIYEPLGTDEIISLSEGESHSVVGNVETLVPSCEWNIDFALIPLAKVIPTIAAIISLTVAGTIATFRMYVGGTIATIDGTLVATLTTGGGPAQASVIAAALAVSGQTLVKITAQTDDVAGVATIRGINANFKGSLL